MRHLNNEAKRLFRAKIASAVYLGEVTPYDISYAAKRRARAISTPSKVDVGAAKRLLRYLAGTADSVITYQPRRGHARCVLSRQLGQQPGQRDVNFSYVTIIFNAPVSFDVGVKGQTAQSIVEAELVAGALATRETVIC